MVRGDFVGDGEVVLDVDFGVFADVTYGGEDFKILSEVFLDGFGFGGGLDDD